MMQHTDNEVGASPSNTSSWIDTNGIRAMDVLIERGKSRASNHSGNLFFRCLVELTTAHNRQTSSVVPTKKIGAMTNALVKFLRYKEMRFLAIDVEDKSKWHEMSETQMKEKVRNDLQKEFYESDRCNGNSGTSKYPFNDGEVAIKEWAVILDTLHVDHQPMATSTWRDYTENDANDTSSVRNKKNKEAERPSLESDNRFALPKQTKDDEKKDTGKAIKIYELQSLDVIIERGKPKHSKHPGNLHFRCLVDVTAERKRQSAFRPRKGVIVSTLFKFLVEKGVRFLSVDAIEGGDLAKNAPVTYHEITYIQAKEKVRNAVKDINAPWSGISDYPFSDDFASLQEWLTVLDELLHCREHGYPALLPIRSLTTTSSGPRGGGPSMAGPWESERQDIMPPSPLLAAVRGMFGADNHRRGGTIMDSPFSQQEVALSPFSNKNQGLSSSPTNAWRRPIALSANDNVPPSMELNKNSPIRSSLSLTESLSKKQRIEPCSPALTTTSPPWFPAAHHGMSPLSLAPLDSVRQARSIALRRLFWEKEIFEQQMHLKMILEHSTGVVLGNQVMLENMDSTRRSTLPFSVLEQYQRTRNVLHSSLRSPASWLHQQDSAIPELPMNDIMDYSSASSSHLLTKHTTAMAAAPRQPAYLDAPPATMAAFMPACVPRQEGWLSGAHSGAGRGSCRPPSPRPPPVVMGDQHGSELPSSETIIPTTTAAAPSSSLLPSEAKPSPSPENTTSSSSTTAFAAPYYTINCSESDTKDIIQAILTTSASTDKERNKGAAMIVEKWLGR